MDTSGSSSMAPSHLPIHSIPSFDFSLLSDSHNLRGVQNQIHDIPLSSLQNHSSLDRLNSRRSDKKEEGVSPPDSLQWSATVYLLSISYNRRLCGSLLLHLA